MKRRSRYNLQQFQNQSYSKEHEKNEIETKHSQDGQKLSLASLLHTKSIGKVEPELSFNTLGQSILNAAQQSNTSESRANAGSNGESILRSVSNDSTSIWLQSPKKKRSSNAHFFAGNIEDDDVALEQGNQEVDDPPKFSTNSKQTGQTNRRRDGMKYMDPSLRLQQVKLLAPLDSGKNIPFGILLPDGTMVKTWETVISLLALLSCFFTPLEFSFLNDKTVYWSPGTQEGIYGLLRFIDVAFILDLGINFCIAYIGPNGHLVTTRSMIAKHYLRGWFAIDFVASVPFDMFLAENASNTVILKLFKATRIVRLSKIIKVLRDALDYHFYFVWTFRLGRLILLMLIALHWVTCAFNSIIATESSTYLESLYSRTSVIEEVIRWEEAAMFEAPPGHRFNNLTSISLGESDYVLPIWVRYGVMFYYVAILFLGNDVYPTTLEEHVVAAIFAIVGAIMQAYILGEVSILLANLSFKSRKWQEKMDSINDAMKYMGINHNLQQRVRTYFEFSWEVHGGDYSHSWMWELSENLHSELLLAQHAKMIRKVPIFQDVNPKFVKAIVLKLNMELYLPGDYVIECGTRGDCMFFITRGTVYCTDENETVIFSVMHEGHFFGEIALLHDSIRTANVRAETFCELNKLTKDDLADVGLEFPEEACSIIAIAKQRELNGASAQGRSVLGNSQQSALVAPSDKNQLAASRDLASAPGGTQARPFPSLVTTSSREVGLVPLDELVVDGAPTAVSPSRLSSQQWQTRQSKLANKRTTRISAFRPTLNKRSIVRDDLQLIHEALQEQRELLEDLYLKSSDNALATRETLRGVTSKMQSKEDILSTESVRRLIGSEVLGKKPI